jgi:hypothetical protein
MLRTWLDRDLSVFGCNPNHVIDRNSALIENSTRTGDNSSGLPAATLTAWILFICNVFRCGKDVEMVQRAVHVHWSYLKIPARRQGAWEARATVHAWVSPRFGVYSSACATSPFVRPRTQSSYG